MCRGLHKGRFLPKHPVGGCKSALVMEMIPSLHEETRGHDIATNAEDQELGNASFSPSISLGRYISFQIFSFPFCEMVTFHIHFVPTLSRTYEA
jgi:hypothetical protein